MTFLCVLFLPQTSFSSFVLLRFVWYHSISFSYLRGLLHFFFSFYSRFLFCAFDNIFYFPGGILSNFKQIAPRLSQALQQADERAYASFCIASEGTSKEMLNHKLLLLCIANEYDKKLLLLSHTLLTLTRLMMYARSLLHYDPFLSNET